MPTHEPTPTHEPAYTPTPAHTHVYTPDPLADPLIEPILLNNGQQANIILTGHRTNPDTGTRTSVYICDAILPAMPYRTRVNPKLPLGWKHSYLRLMAQKLAVDLLPFQLCASMLPVVNYTLDASGALTKTQDFLFAPSVEELPDLLPLLSSLSLPAGSRFWLRSLSADNPSLALTADATGHTTPASPEEAHGVLLCFGL